MLGTRQVKEARDHGTKTPAPIYLWPSHPGTPSAPTPCCAANIYYKHVGDMFCMAGDPRESSFSFLLPPEKVSPIPLCSHEPLPVPCRDALQKRNNHTDTMSPAWPMMARTRHGAGLQSHPALSSPSPAMKRRRAPSPGGDVQHRERSGNAARLRLQLTVRL